MRSRPDELCVLGSRPAVLGDQGQISAVPAPSVRRLSHGGAKLADTRASDAIQGTRLVIRTSPPRSCARLPTRVCVGIIRRNASRDFYLRSRRITLRRPVWLLRLKSQGDATTLRCGTLIDADPVGLSAALQTFHPHPTGYRVSNVFVHAPQRTQQTLHVAPPHLSPKRA